MFILRTRRGKLKKSLEEELAKGTPTLENVLEIIDTYETENLATIKKLKRGKEVTTKRINGALKQTINAHGPITKQYLSSATKRIYGSILLPEEPEYMSLWDTIKSLFR
jgi:hypothetical protein